MASRTNRPMIKSLTQSEIDDRIAAADMAERDGRTHDAQRLRCEAAIRAPTARIDVAGYHLTGALVCAQMGMVHSDVHQTLR